MICFGGKSRVAHLVWERFGNVPNYVESFYGSGAVLLARPHEPGIETVNDKDGFVCNAWRSIAAAPDDTADYADWPSNECDLHARHLWLKARRAELSERLMADPDYYDAKIAGWWLWGMAQWIGGGFCGESGSGPWGVVDGRFQKLDDDNAGHGVERRRVHLGDAGQGVERRRVVLSSAGRGLSGSAGQGLRDWFNALARRLRFVRVCCGDWSRIMGPTPTEKLGVTGIFLDPPYSSDADRDENIYSEEDLNVAHDVRKWCIENGDNPLLRIALCGYEGEHEMPESWDCVAWKAQGGYANLGDKRGRENAGRERIWFSPYCLAARQRSLF